MSPRLYCGSLVPIAKEHSLYSVEAPEGVWRLKPSRGHSRTHLAILPQGECCSSNVLLGQTSHTHYPKLELLGPGKTVLLEPNAKVAWCPLN